ncbi:hypothetical protein STRIC_0605 [Streptococcus ictaluri 707-05]|uniref:Uncharacterized protein n=1 Tax=Streptococcus ictaluri 707-05 TaxID=764299 RepID=G5K6B7_9STRE|nr:hypothetical protein STRIC_0605 [Streptococcus ictaluri 707-05]
MGNMITAKNEKIGVNINEIFVKTKMVKKTKKVIISAITA